MPTPTKYTYQIAQDFPSGSMREENLISEIQQTSSISVALDWAAGAVNRNGNTCNIWFLDALAETGSLDAVISAHDHNIISPPDKVEISGGVLQASDKALIVEIEPTEGTKVTIISPNWCDRRTWYYNSVRVNNELFSSSDGWVTYDSEDSHAWVDVSHGRITQEHELRYSYAPVVKVNDVTKKENDPSTSNGDYDVDYFTGKIIFNSALQATDVVKVSYSYVSGSEWRIAPPADKKLRISEVEVQFSEDVVLNDTVSFQLYVGGSPYGSASYYQTMHDYINESNKSYPVIPALGGSGSWRSSPQPIHIFRWDYKTSTDLKANQGMEISVKLESDTEFGGTFAVATFYGVVVNN